MGIPTIDRDPIADPYETVLGKKGWPRVAVPVKGAVG